MLASTILLISAFTSPGLVAAENHEGEVEPLNLSFYQADGAHFAELLDVNGSATGPLRNATWSLQDIDTNGTLLSGMYLTNVNPVSADVFLWNLTTDISGMNCTCVLHIEDDGQGNYRSWALLLYIGEQNHRPVLDDELSPYRHATMNTPMRQSHPAVVSSAFTLSEGLILPPMSNALTKVSAKVCEAPNGVCVASQTTHNLPFNFSSDAVNIIVNPADLELSQGLWQFEISATDDLLRSTGDVIKHFLYDVQPPHVTLSLHGSVNESEPLIVYATAQDGYVGSVYNYTWSIVDENGTKVELVADNTIQSGQIVLNITQQGTYVVEVVVRDRAGFTNTTSAEFVVLNIRPTARVSVDGFTVSKDTKVVLPEGVDWLINGSQSYDNEPIDYLWVINEERSLRGISSLDQQHFDGPGTYRVELIVFDDDGFTHSNAVMVEILGAEGPDNTTSTGWILAGLAGLVVVLLAIKRFGSRQTTELPKWASLATANDGKDTTTTQDVDATIQEDEHAG